MFNLLFITKEHMCSEQKVSVSVGGSMRDQDVNLLYVLFLTGDNFITDKKSLNGFFNELILPQHRGFLVRCWPEKTG